MSKQDRQGVRTPVDIERKYDLASLVGIKKAVENSVDGLNKTNTTLEEFMRATLGTLDNMQSQIDGNITTWFSGGVPTLSTYPASDWESEEIKANHIGDLYYDQDTGYAYRFAFSDGKYQWMKIVDNDVVEALALANAASDTADSKRRVFTEQPAPPYDSGDLWFKDGDIYICQISKDEGESYAEKDFIIATKYTDDTYAKQVGNELTVVKGTVTTIQEGMDSYKVEISTKVSTLDTELEVAKTSIEANTEAIDLRVKKDSVIAAINVSPEGVKISGSKIDIEGAVTFSSLSSDVSDALESASSNATTALNNANGAYSQANAAISTANTAKTTADNASKTATNANTTANAASTNASTALSTANTANSTANSIKANIYVAGTTKIDGGKIYTNSIKADAIDVTNLFAQEITATGTVRGLRLEGGSINLEDNGNIENPSLRIYNSAAGDLAKYGSGLIHIATDGIEYDGGYLTKAMQLSPNRLVFGRYPVASVDASDGIELFYRGDDAGWVNIHNGLVLHNASGKGGIMAFTYVDTYDAIEPLLRITANDYSSYVDITATGITPKGDEFTIGASDIVTINATVSSVLTAGKVKTVAGADLDGVAAEVDEINSNLSNKQGVPTWLVSNNVDNVVGNNANFNWGYGLIDNQGYFSITMGWIAIQFRTQGLAIQKRVRYGSTGWSSWSNF